MGYATVEDLVCEVRDPAAAEKLLERASTLIDDVIGSGAKPSEATLKGICCAMVERALAPLGTDMYGVTQYSQTAGPYSGSMTYSNPMGELYLTREERRRLTRGTSAIFGIDPDWGGR